MLTRPGHLIYHGTYGLIKPSSSSLLNDLLGSADKYRAIGSQLAR